MQSQPEEIFIAKREAHCHKAGWADREKTEK